MSEQLLQNTNDESKRPSWEDQCKQKMNSLNDSTAQIQTVSAYLVFYRRKAVIIAQIWQDVLLNDAKNKLISQINLLYLVNDILQTSRNKGPEFFDALRPILPEIMQKLYSQWQQLRSQNHAEYAKKVDSIVQKVQRLFNVWQERKIFNDAYIQSLAGGLSQVQPGASSTPLSNSSQDSASSISSSSAAGSSKKRKAESDTSASSSSFKQQQQQQASCVEYQKLIEATNKIAILKQDPTKLESVVQLRKAMLQVLKEQLDQNTKLLEQEQVQLNQQQQ
ncbi:hypothetical protein MIR68_002357 [Amoeboaphelidium protococcarum]|nr:hypothetical protein MIR68_002357 [Amoeboaphelidium protococcarum]